MLFSRRWATVWVWSVASVGALAGACSSSDDRVAKRGEAGAAGQAPENGDGNAGEGGVGAAGNPQTDGGAGGEAAGNGGSIFSGGAGEAGATSGCVPSTGEGGDAGATAGSRVLYTNDFESPNQEVVASCGNSLDPVGINTLYGSESFAFQQAYTVEGVLVDDPVGLYSDPAGTGDGHALGMLSNAENDLLALTFEVTGKAFLNVGFDLSAIDVSGCGGPFGVATPVMQVRLYDTPSGTFSFGEPGALLAEGSVTGVEPPDAWTFAWTYGVVSLDATGFSGASLTVVFDLQQSGYAAFDNLSIVASDRAGVVDANNDGIPDDQCSP